MNAIILHGTGTKNNEFWFPYVKEKLEDKGYEVWLPQLPNDEKPNVAEWLPFVMDGAQFDKDTVLIGHSAGSQLILSILEKLQHPIKQAILVSGYAKHLRATADAENSIDEPNWDAIKGKAADIIFLNSDNDPWGCDDEQGKIMKIKLGGTQITMKGEGHMGSSVHNQPYKEFPFLVRLVK